MYDKAALRLVGNPAAIDQPESTHERLAGFEQSSLRVGLLGVWQGEHGAAPLSDAYIWTALIGRAMRFSELA